MKCRAVVLAEPGGPLLVDEVECPDPGDGQLQVKLFASGICHSQIHQMHDPHGRLPMLFGDEATGVVQVASKSVKDVNEGDHVIVSRLPWGAASVGQTPRIPATSWRGKQAGRNVCTWAERVVVPQEFVVKIDRDIPTDITAVMGCAVMTGCGAVVNTAKVERGHSVAVFGLGGVGLCIISAAVVVGAHPIIAVDIRKEKLALARKFGATHVIDSSEGDPVEAVRDFSGGGVDFAFDAVGTIQTMDQILRSTRPLSWGLNTGGTAVLVGWPPNDFDLDARFLLMGERKFIGCLGGSSKPRLDIPRYLQWFREGRLRLNELVTNRFRLDEINVAVEALSGGEISGRGIIEF